MTKRKIWLVLLLVVGMCLGWLLDSAVAKDAECWFRDLTTDDVFSCDLRISRNQYVIDEPVRVTVRLTNHTDYDVRIRDCAQHYPFYWFEITNPAGKQLSPSEKLSRSMADIKPEWRTIKPDRIYDAEIDISQWYNLSQPGRYTIKANWSVKAKRSPYNRESNTVTVAVVPQEQKEIVDLIRRATLITCCQGGEESYKLKLVQMGRRAVPALLEWVELEKLNKEIPQERNVWSYFNNVLEVLSQIGSDDARKIIIESRVGSDKYREALLKRIDIWQSPDKFEQLIEALNEPQLGKKWVIFKLGILGDKRAIPVLEEMVQNDKSLDVRETAKDALAHLNNPDIPMRYIMHRRSERIELKPTKQEYKLGEPIEIHCKITAGEYGSHKLAEFSNPCWHFLPWGRMRADEKISEPFRLRMQKERKSDFSWRRRLSKWLRRGMTRHGRMIPVKELKSKKKRLADRKEEPLEGYVDLNKLKFKGGFALQPGESREYILKDLSSAFEITEPGEYIIYEFPFGKSSSLSNRITIIISSLLAFSTSSAQSKSITIGEAELLYTEDEIPIRYDDSLSTIQKDANTMYFFHSFGCRIEPGEKRRSRHSWYHGPPIDPLKIHDFSKTEEDFWDYNGYYQDTKQEGVWIVGMYKRDNGDLLGITHSEVTYASDETRFHFSVGLGYSVNNGESWTYCGEIIRAADDSTNVGGGAYIIVGDYLYVYYNDTDTTDRSRRQCVARSKLDDVLKKASNHKVGPWYKYKDGRWDTPGLSNTAGTDVIPKVYGGEDVHSDAAYCTALGKYLLTVQTHKAHKLLLFSSTDGIQWTREAIVDETDDDVLQPYSSFVDYNGPTDDCREVDGSFYIYYPRKRYSDRNQDDMFRRLITIE